MRQNGNENYMTTLCSFPLPTRHLEYTTGTSTLLNSGARAITLVSATFLPLYELTQHREALTTLPTLLALASSTVSVRNALSLLSLVFLAFSNIYVPQLPMPPSLATRLSRRYRIKSGVPTLVLLDREGATVSISAQDRLIEDPLGTCFPWRPRPVDQVLKDVALQPGGTYFCEHKNSTKEDIRYGDLPAGCPPCRAFTPQLAEVYRIVKKKEPGFEILFVSSDRAHYNFIQK
ncbi:hypothetical protein NQ318_002024 [Aromia moschata]|uniref:Thioredoxin-like fold domain-containing protein n=1 Tax=Aromia moschata TaxID=1265417 RepID=A0AAV8Z386_9CUCU|nr:hypothetical protein NQ318_002024 [Aromia moschata]